MCIYLSIGSLSVKVKDLSTHQENTAFVMSGNQLKEWKDASFDVSSSETSGYQVFSFFNWSSSFSKMRMCIRG